MRLREYSESAMLANIDDAEFLSSFHPFSRKQQLITSSVIATVAILGLVALYLLKKLVLK